MESNSKHLIIAANGLIGGQLLKLLEERQQTCLGTTYSRPKNKLVHLDILNREQMQELLLTFKPTVVYLAANFPGGVNRCESEKAEAQKFHFYPLELLSEFCKILNFALVYYSTDYVFDNRTQPVKENDQRYPLNFYGTLKLEAENFIAGNFSKHVIIRTTNVYGFDPETKTPNFFMQVLRQLEQGKVFQADPNMQATPTTAFDVARAGIDLVEHKQWGTFHVVGDEQMTRLEWAQKMAMALGYDHKFIQQIANTSVSTIQRPTNLRLSNKKIKETLGFQFQQLTQGMSVIQNQISQTSGK